MSVDIWRSLLEGLIGLGSFVLLIFVISLAALVLLVMLELCLELCLERWLSRRPAEQLWYEARQNLSGDFDAVVWFVLSVDLRRAASRRLQRFNRVRIVQMSVYILPKDRRMLLTSDTPVLCRLDEDTNDADALARFYDYLVNNARESTTNMAVTDLISIVYSWASKLPMMNSGRRRTWQSLENALLGSSDPEHELLWLRFDGPVAPEQLSAYSDRF